MNREEFIDKWNEEKAMYRTWGEFVISEIKQAITDKGYSVDSFLKHPAKARVKDVHSLVDKAFFRKDKNYQDPYNEIEDKVGGRFIVLLVDQIKELASIIESSQYWQYKECRHFEAEREEAPLLFTYQSVHYVVRASNNIEKDGILVKKDTPCEIQLRTLLQHAYAELTHDAIYKAKRRVQPKVHRTVAKSMALIETTDDFFAEVNTSLNSGDIESSKFIEKLDSLYFELIEQSPLPIQKSSLAVLDEYEYLINDETTQKIKDFFLTNEYISEIIQSKAAKQNPFFQQSISLFSCWLLLRHNQKVQNDWPIEWQTIKGLATDLGVNL